jgi:ATP-dependent protease ClpP protease subunit
MHTKLRTLLAALVIGLAGTFGPAAHAEQCVKQVDIGSAYGDVAFFNGEIDDKSAAEFRATLEEWWFKRQGKPGVIRIVLDSPGGGVIESFGMVDEINSLQCRGNRVIIVVNGIAASAASWVVESADVRIIGANSWIMIHGVSTQAQGKLPAIEAELELTKKLQAQGLAIIARRSGLDLSVINQKIANANWFVTAQEAKELHLVDEVAGDPRIKAS